MAGLPTTAATTAKPALAANGDLERRLEAHRRELTGYCYRMLGSSFEAEDAVQDTMLRAWRSIDRFEGRSALKSWLYRIATNVCLDMLNGRQRRARPMELTEVGTPASSLHTLPEVTWLEPIPDARVLPESSDPAELAQAQETLRLAFVAALQHLPAAPARGADPARGAALERRRDGRAARHERRVGQQRAAARPGRRSPTTDADDRGRARDAGRRRGRAARPLRRRLRAYDIDALVALLHEDATLSMPPFDLWLRGPSTSPPGISAWATSCRGSRLIATSGANGLPAFGQYRPTGPGGSFEPWALQVIEHSDGRITGLNAFLDTARWFPLFGLPLVPTGYRLARALAAAGRRTARRRRAAARARATRRAAAACSPAAGRSAAGARAPRPPRDRPAARRPRRRRDRRPTRRSAPAGRSHDDRDVGLRDRRKGHDGGVGIGNRSRWQHGSLGLLAQQRPHGPGKLIAAREHAERWLSLDT